MQSNIGGMAHIFTMAHTALGCLKELNKKELSLAAMTITIRQEEFNQSVKQRNNALIVDSVVVSGDDNPDLKSQCSDFGT